MAGAGQRGGGRLDRSLDDMIDERRRAQGGREPSGRYGGREPKGGGGGRVPKGKGREPKGGGKSGRGADYEMADHSQAATVLDPADGTFENWPKWLTGKLIMARRPEVIRTWIQSPCICF
jgi:hypothetical protein